MSGGVAYVYDPYDKFAARCNQSMVDLEVIGPAEPPEADEPERPHQRSVSVHDNGMGDMLRYDAERLRILVERHRLMTHSKRASELLDDWETTLRHFVKVMPQDYRRGLLELKAEGQAAIGTAAE